MATPGKRTLQRRLFLALAAAIAATAVTVMAVAWVGRLVGPGDWRRHFEQTRGALARHFARVWDDPRERDRFGKALADDLGTTLVLAAPDGRILARFGPPCDRRWSRTPVPGPRGVGRPRGELQICRPPPGVLFPWPPLVGLVVALAVLWLLAGRVARRLARPLVLVSQVARDIGEGKLHSRVPDDEGLAGEVQVLASSINDMAARIERQLGEQRELLATVSHELRTPLGHMRLLVEMARERGADAPLCAQLDQELDETDDLVGQLLATARLDFTALSPQPLDATELALRALERAGADPSVLQVDAPGAKVQGDATLLARALANLLDNARRHGGRLQALRVTRQGDRIVFEVEDDGAGFALGAAERAFEPFQAGPAGGPRRASTLGLGLALVQRIARAHGGEAFAGNRDGGGAKVGFGVPVG